MTTSNQDTNTKNQNPSASQMVDLRLTGPRRTSRSSRSRGSWNLGYFIREGFTSIFRHGLMSFAAVCMTVACLLIMGTFSLVAVNMDANLKKLEADNEFSAYVEDGYTVEQAQALESQIAAIPNVREVVFEDRQTVLEEFQSKRQGESELFGLLPEDTFQHQYHIRVNDIATLSQTVAAVDALTGIAETSAGIEIAQGMIAVRNVAAGVALILMAILVVVSLFIIASTLRLATFYRRDEIAIMKMCGATNGFIRWPFIMEGAMLGLFSAVLAFGLQWWLYTLLAKAMASEGTLNFLVVIPFTSLWGMVLGVFCAAGLAIGVIGSLFAIRKFLQV